MYQAVKRMFSFSFFFFFFFFQDMKDDRRSKELIYDRLYHVLMHFLLLAPIHHR